MTHVIFNLLPEQKQDEPQLDVVACQFVKAQYLHGKKLMVYTENQRQAEQIDELLWQSREPFVPHNLLGEGPKFGTPVEISWKAPVKRRPVLINLHHQVPDFAGQFQLIFEFVANDESLKQLARERYKHYRHSGFSIATEQL